MKKLLFIGLMVTLSVQAEDIFMKPKKKESAAKIKEQLVHDFEDLLQLATCSIRELTNLLDEVVVGVKQLAGQQDGVLSTSDKKVLQSHQEKVNDLRELLSGLQKNCTLHMD